MSEKKRVARAVAAQTGELPDELLLTWARTGWMTYPARGGAPMRSVELEPSDRIACAKGCASYYKAPYQSRPAPGAQPPVVRLELDDKMVAALAQKAPDKLELLRDVLKAIQSGSGMAEAARVEASSGEGSDPARYASMLSADSETAGRA